MVAILTCATEGVPEDPLNALAATLESGNASSRLDSAVSTIIAELAAEVPTTCDYCAALRAHERAGYR